MVGEQLIHVEGTDTGVSLHVTKPKLYAFCLGVEILVLPHLSLEDNPLFISVFPKINYVSANHEFTTMTKKLYNISIFPGLMRSLNM